MSHFGVAVISDGTKTIEELLAPYQENSCEPCPKRYMEFNCTEDEYREDYENAKQEMVRLLDGTMLPKYDERFRVPAHPYGHSSDDRWEYPEDCIFVDVPFKYTYPTLEAYIEQYLGERKDEETGKYGFWENPNAKWDWYQIGGRWHGYLRGGDIMQFKDCDFSPFPDKYKAAIHEWERAVEGKPGEDGEWPIRWKPTYYTERYDSKEDFARYSSMWATRAVITPDGEWHEVGEMGWWACSTEGHDDIKDWYDNYKARFIDTAKPDWHIAIVDCHI